MISFFSLRSEVTKEDSADHEPWSIPPSLSSVMDLPLPTVNSYLLLLSATYREPIVSLETTERPEPKRENPRIERDDPSVTLSNTDMEEANRDNPHKANAAPNLAMLLSDTEDPKAPNPKTEIEAPTRDNVLRERELPN
jgi:hypothetical protein